MTMPELFYGSIAVAPLIVALIALFKRFGLPVEYAPYLNVALGLIFVALIYATGLFPDIQQPVTFALNIVIAVLTTAGFYDAQKNVTRAIRAA